MMMRVCSYASMMLNVAGMFCSLQGEWRAAAVAYAGASTVLAYQCYRYAKRDVMMKGRSS